VCDLIPCAAAAVRYWAIGTAKSTDDVCGICDSPPRPTSFSAGTFWDILGHFLIIAVAIATLFIALIIIEGSHCLSNISEITSFSDRTFPDIFGHSLMI
jgi:hypothetical protein